MEEGLVVVGKDYVEDDGEEGKVDGAELAVAGDE